MAIFEKIKQIFRQGIFNKNQPKLLMPPKKVLTENDEVIDFDEIKDYLEIDKYKKNLYVSIFELTTSIRKKLIKKIDEYMLGKIGETYDNFTLVEGKISGQDFICVRKIDVADERYGQTIITDNGYIDISTRKSKKRNKQEKQYEELYYKELIKDKSVEELYEYGKESEKYYRRIKKSNIVFIEFAMYGNNEKASYMEQLAQPSSNQKEIDEYSKATGLKYIGNENQHNIADILRSEPYIVYIEVQSQSKEGSKINKQSIIKVYKSKKECIVGYRPEMILLEGMGEEPEKPQMYRLLPEGLYVDNLSFKQDFEGKYSFKKVSLDDITKKVTGITFDLSSEAKNILRNGLSIPNHVKVIYDIGIEQIKRNKLDETEEDKEVISVELTQEKLS